MKFLIIGLGIYGENLARDLTEMGHEVIGADNSQSSIESLKNYISTVYLIDSTEESQLAVLPLLNVDLVIVAIGENFGASIKTVALLKSRGKTHIRPRYRYPARSYTPQFRNRPHHHARTEGCRRLNPRARTGLGCQNTQSRCRYHSGKFRSTRLYARDFV